MKIAVEALDDDITCISLAGSLDIESAQKIDPQMADVAKDCQWLVVDMMHVDYLASFGIRTLITTAQTVQRSLQLRPFKRTVGKWSSPIPKNWLRTFSAIW